MKKIALLALVVWCFSLRSDAQHILRQRIPTIGSKAPSFKAPSTEGEIAFPEDYGKQWKILFAHPRDFTPVCSSEILELAHNKEEFTTLNTQLIVVSVDKMASHKHWKADLEQVNLDGRGMVSIDFPLVVDSSSTISYKYGMTDLFATSKHTIRGVFFIDPENKIRSFLFYPNEVGRNIDEIIRLLKALQAQQANPNNVMPANWQPGKEVMIPELTPADKEELQKPNPSIHFINWYMIYKKPDEFPQK